MNKLRLAALLAATLLTAFGASASSHREAPMITSLPKLDSTDVYAFTSYEPGRSNYVTLIADYQPFQEPFGGPNYYYLLETNGIYEIEIDGNGDAQEDITFQFQFYITNKNLSLPIGPPGNQVTNAIALIDDGSITSSNSPTLGLVETYTVKMIYGSRRNGTPAFLTNTADGTTMFTVPVDNIGTKTIPNYKAYASNFLYNVTFPGGTSGKLFVGPRKDPFVVNLGETFDLVNYSNPLGPVNGEQDSLINKNITSLILEVPKSILTNYGSSIIGVWTSASLFQGSNIVQMSRLGSPLVNELVIGLKDKDTFSGSVPANDAQFAPYVTNPTFPAILQLLFGSVGVVAPTNFPRTDLVSVFLTGVAGLNNHTGVPSEMIRLNTATPPTLASAQNNLGVIGGDLAGYPNGRRPGDDVVDISLRVLMGKLLSTNDAPSGQLPFTDGAYIDASFFPAAWPYINTPLPGSPQSLSITINVQASGTVTGPYSNVRASYDPKSSTVTTAKTGNIEFYRTGSTVPGVVLGKPAVSGSNVSFKLSTP